MALTLAAQAHAQTAAQPVTATTPTIGAEPEPVAGGAPRRGNSPAAVSNQTESVTVTGTQIRGVAPVGSTIVRLDQKQIQQTGLVTTADIIHSIPQVSGIGPNEGTKGTNANNATLNITDANAIDLRGLGVQATLTLLDGRRVPPGGEGAQLFDPSSIPAIALSRIDVVPDGASAIYGSDAVAGVANLILRKNFVGLEGDVNYGTASNYSQRQVDAIGGTKWDGGSLMIAAEYTEHTNLSESDRANLFNCNEIPYGGKNNCSFDAVPGNVIDPATKVRYALPGGSGVGLTADDLTVGPANTANAYTSNNILPQLDRESVVGSFSQKLLPGVNFWAEGYYTNRRFEASSAAATIDSSTPVPSTNPFFISFYPGQTSETVQYSMRNDFGPEIHAGYERAYQIAGGFDVDLGHDIRLSMYGQNSGDVDKADTENVINNLDLDAALADSNPATAFNPFGSGGNNNPATLASFRAYNEMASDYQQNLGNVKLDGPVFDLPGGKVRFAVGGQFYTESLFDDEIGNQNSPGIADLVEPTNVTTSRNVSSAFGEALIPIIGPDNRLPLLYRLEVDAAGRYDDYSDVGHTLNPKVSVRWDPIRQVTIHGTYGTSFRAPTLCDLNAQCTATVFQLPNFGPGGNVVEIAGGNASLKPETATTESGGFDYHPDWLPGLKASVNYFHINYQNIIDTPALLNIAVFTQPGLYAPFVTHNPTAAQLAAVYANPFAPPPLFAFSQVNNLVDGRRQNVGSSVTDGLDLGLDYNFENRYGAFDVGGDGTYEFNYQYQLLPGAPVLNRLNQVNYPLRFRMRDHISWALNGFGATVFVNYNNAYNNTTGVVSPLQRIDAYTTADLHLSYTTGENPSFNKYARNIIFSVTLQNIFNAQPPFAIVSTAQQYDSEVANPIGRLITFDLRKSF